MICVFRGERTAEDHPSRFNSGSQPDESLIPLCRNFIDVASYLSKAILAQFPNAIAPDAIGVDQSSSLEGTQVLCDSLPRELGAIG
jgi:hypothetical protein